MASELIRRELGVSGFVHDREQLVSIILLLCWGSPVQPIKMEPRRHESRRENPAGGPGSGQDCTTERKTNLSKVTNKADERQQRLGTAAMKVAIRLLTSPANAALQPGTTVGDSPRTCPSSLPRFGTSTVQVADGSTRIAGRCQTVRCGYWSGHCGLGVAVSIAGRTAVGQGLAAASPCELMTSCRWFAENGTDACHICDLVTRDPAESPALRELFETQPLQEAPNGR